MSAHVLLNLLNEQFVLFSLQFNKTGAQLLDSIISYDT